MTRLAVHIRIAKPDPTDADVRTRQQAIDSVVAAWKEQSDFGELIEKASQIAIAIHGNGTPEAALGQEIEAAIQAVSPSYVYTERPLEVGVCAAAAALDLIETAEYTSETTGCDMFAAALWSALAYQPSLSDTRREAMRTELLEACRTRTAEAAKAARERDEIDDYGEDDEDEEVKRVTSAAIESLKRNALIDREELNFLWWVQLNRSRLLKKQLGQIPEEVRLLACAIEGAQQLKALPAEVHRDLVLRTQDADPSLDHTKLLEKIGADRAALDVAYGAVDIVQKLPAVFPLLSSLRETGKVSKDAAKVARSSSEWATRALLEAAIAELYRAELVEL